MRKLRRFTTTPTPTQTKMNILFVSNIKEVTERLIKKLNSISNGGAVQDKMIREVAFTSAAEMRERIHERGQDASGAQIGTYSPQYLRTRVKKYNRTADPRVVLSLTRQMENDFTTGADNSEPTKTNKGYGIGFKNPVNFQKSQWCEETYGKPIYRFTTNERANVPVIVKEYINKNVIQI